MIHKGHTYLLAAWVALLCTLVLYACQRTAGNGLGLSLVKKIVEIS